MGETSPRTSRRKAFSSRSIASVPAARSTVTNMSEIAIATAAAKVESGVVPPLTTSESILIGLPIVLRISSERSRFSCASWPKRITLSSSSRACGVRRQLRLRVADDRLRPPQAEHLDVASQDRQRDAAAVDDQVQIADRDLGDLLRERGVRILRPRLDGVLDVAGLDRILRVVEDLHRRRLGRLETLERLELLRDVRGDDQRGQDVAALDLLERLLLTLFRGTCPRSRSGPARCSRTACPRSRRA